MNNLSSNASLWVMHCNAQNVMHCRIIIKTFYYGKPGKTANSKADYEDTINKDMPKVK